MKNTMRDSSKGVPVPSFPLVSLCRPARAGLPTEVGCGGLGIDKGRTKSIILEDKRLGEISMFKMVVRVFAQIKLEGGYYISNCPQFDVWSQGRTREEAKNNLIEAVSLFLVSCYERGTLDEALLDCGYRAVAQPHGAAEIKEKTPPGMTPINIQIPFTLGKPRRGAQKCHA